MTFYSEYHFTKSEYSESTRVDKLNKILNEIEKECMKIISISSRDNDDSVTYGITYQNGLIYRDEQIKS